MEGEKIDVIPVTFIEATGLPETALWKAASEMDMTSLEQHHFYDLVPSISIPAGQKSVGSRWVFKQ